MSARGVPPDDGPESALREVRDRFVAGFPAQCASIASLLAHSGESGADPRRAGLVQIVHRMTGLAGTVGFPTVSRRAGELESQLLKPVPDVEFAALLLSGIHEGFAADLVSPPDWAGAREGGDACRVLLVEDDADQADVLTLHLGGAGHQTRVIGAGDAAVAAVREWRPDVVLLDVNLPGLDGHTVCRLLKSEPELAAIPVVFLTTRAGLNERLAGLTLGADEYLCKPIDPRELLIRVARAARRARSAPAPEPETAARS